MKLHLDSTDYKKNWIRTPTDLTVEPGTPSVPVDGFVLKFRSFRFARIAFPIIYAVLVLAALAILSFNSSGAGVYSRLAESFLQGRLSYVTLPSSGVLDMAFFNSRYYNPFGVLPAVVAVPFVWAGYFPQGAVNFVVCLTVFYLCYRIARDSGYSMADSSWLAIAFCFGTAFIEVAFFNWHIAYTFGVLFLVLAIYEQIGSRRPWLIGIFLGCAMASRPVMALNLLFFVLAILLEQRSLRDRAARAFSMCACFGVIAASIGLYNFARFGTPFEFGYTYQVYSETLPHRLWNVRGNVAGPLFSLLHIPINLMTFLFGLPDSEGIGTSVLLMSPYFIYLFGGRRWERVDWLIVVNTILIAVTMLSFRSTGFRQAGYRFSLEFMPLLFWLLIRRRSGLPFNAKALILIASITDFSLIVYFLAVRLS